MGTYKFEVYSVGVAPDGRELVSATACSAQDEAGPYVYPPFGPRARQIPGGFHLTWSPPRRHVDGYVVCVSQGASLSPDFRVKVVTS